jgi:hypothetical protein
MGAVGPLIALVPGYLTYLYQEMRMTLRTAALYDRDPQELKTAGEMLALRGVHANVEQAEAALIAVKNIPMPKRPTQTSIASHLETHARQLERRALVYYDGEAASVNAAIALAARRRDCGHDKRALLRAIALFLSVAIPLGFIAVVNHRAASFIVAPARRQLSPKNAAISPVTAVTDKDEAVRVKSRGGVPFMPRYHQSETNRDHGGFLAPRPQA